MADNDDRSVLQVTGDSEGKPSLQSLNEVLRQIQMNSHKQEGRLGESTIRDDLRVMGKETWEMATTQTGEAGSGVVYFDQTLGKFRVSENGAVMVNLITNPKAIVVTIGDITGSAITTGVKGYIPIPVSCTVTAWVLVADAVGSIVIDVWKDAFVNFPPTVADTIAGSEKPTLTGQQANQDQSLSTWTTAITAGDILGFNVSSAATVKQVTLTLSVTV